MGSWELALEIDEQGDLPVFLRIARSIASEVRRGRLQRGAALPGARTLAQQLGVHRNTVTAAYRELVAEGWARSLPARGTVVSSELPDPRPRHFAREGAQRERMPARPAYELYSRPPSPRPIHTPPPLYPMAGGIPDVRLCPREALARAYRRVLLGRSRRGQSPLDYGDPRGHPRLRKALAEMLSSRRGLAAGPDEVLITRGSQMALDLVARTLVKPGDAVAVEAMGYPPAWQALRLAGARLVPVPVDASGLSVAALRELCAKQPLRAVYVTPHHQYPTGVCLAPGRRLELLELAREHRFAVIEDDYDHEFHYDGRPVLPLAAADRAGSVVYIGTLSKLLAPGLRIGFAVAPLPLLHQLAELRQDVDRQGDQAVECAVAELYEDGEVQRHARRAREAYRSRRDALCEALAAELGERVRFQPPRGGMALWAQTSCDAEEWAAAALERGVAIGPGRRFSFSGQRRRFARLGFATLAPPELREAVHRLAAAFPSG